MQTIYKYPLSPHIGVDLPVGAEILTVQMQHGAAWLWAKIDTDQHKTENRKIRCYGTGHKMNGVPAKYIGTFQIDNGALVFHVFEE